MGNLRFLRSPDSAPGRRTNAEHERRGGSAARERRRLERDLHDGVQSQLVALIVKLAIVRDDRDTPPALADTLAALEAHAQAVLDSVRNIARGIYPAVLADFGLRDALRSQALRGSIDLTIVGSAPRSTEDVEEAMYFACSEAIQNIAKHAGGGARGKLELNHRHRSLLVQIVDDGRGFRSVGTSGRGGLQNIHDRIEDLGGTVELVSAPGRGTRLTLSLPWPVAAHR